MPISKKRKESMYKYAKENLKRVPLDMQISEYEKLKAAASVAGESVNGYIKQAIDERIEALKNPFILDEKTTQIICGEEYNIYYRKRIIKRAIAETIERDQVADQTSALKNDE